MKPKNKILLIFIIICIIFYIVSKLILLNQLKLNEIDISKNNTPTETIKITKQKCLNCFYNYDKSIKLENYIQDFNLVDNNKEYEFYQSIDGKSSIYFSKEKPIIKEIFNKNNSKYKELNSFPTYISETTKKHILKKYNIKNDIDLLKHIKNNQKKPNIFTPLIKIKETYLFNYLNNSVKNNYETVYFNGYNNGYITISNDNMYITIITKDYNYLITIHNLEYFTKDKVISMISSIEIK